MTPRRPGRRVLRRAGAALRRVAGVLSGALRRRVPAGTQRGGRPGDPGLGGGSGVREPRRPAPTAPATSAARAESAPDTYLDLSGR